MEADVQAVGLGVAWYEVVQGRKQWEEVCRQCRAYDINKDIGHCATNSSYTNVDTSFHAHVGALSDAKKTSHGTDNSVMVHNTKATEKWPTLLIASVEELSAGKEIVHNIPTAAPLIPLDFLLVNIQGIVPQDTAIILKMGSYKVCVCVCTAAHVPQ